jgi:hypothetical protein
LLKNASPRPVRRGDDNFLRKRRQIIQEIEAQDDVAAPAICESPAQRNNKFQFIRRYEVGD